MLMLPTRRVQASKFTVFTSCLFTVPRASVFTLCGSKHESAPFRGNLFNPNPSISGEPSILAPPLLTAPHAHLCLAPLSQCLQGSSCQGQCLGRGALQNAHGEQFACGLRMGTVCVWNMHGGRLAWGKCGGRFRMWQLGDSILYAAMAMLLWQATIPTPVFMVCLPTHSPRIHLGSSSL